MFRKFKHNSQIPKYPRGTIDKCKEELAELEDADSQGNRWHSVIEAADLVNSTYTFIWKKYRVPFFVVVMIAMATGLYKPIVRAIRKVI